jgi:predicted nuclease with TOPRIM domain
MELGSKFPESPDSMDHQYYESLCALATSGALTQAEWQTIRSHIAICPTCETLLGQYRSVAKNGMSLLMSKADPKTLPQQQEWSVESAKKELFARIAQGEAATRVYSPRRGNRAKVRLGWAVLVSASAQRYAAYAAVLAFVILLPLVAFKEGQRRGMESVQSRPSVVSPESSELASLSREHSALARDVADREARITDLQRQLNGEQGRIAQLRTYQSQLQQSSSQSSAEVSRLKDQTTTLAAERDTIARKLQEAQSSLEPLEREIESLQQERSRGLLHTAALEKRIEDLSTRLKDSDDTTQQQAQFLASDRDIRELMGARDLYIADVFDVDREGQTQKVFGRVFYTSGKSLIFYAFDLDKQPGLKDASTFQAWGRRGPNDKRPLNMGIFYLDSQAKKRWVLRFDDPKLLNQIDAVFVTVEPNGGRPKPSGKQLLFASLRTPPNHP